jgi:CrcB protein
MMTILSIAFFGLCGVLARYGVGLVADEFLASAFPYATFLINILGSCLIGIFYVVGTKQVLISSAIRIGIMVGFLGGFTTFSSYCLDTFKLVERGRFVEAGLYFALSPILGLVACWTGIIATQWVVSRAESVGESRTFWLQRVLPFRRSVSARDTKVLDR